MPAELTVTAADSPRDRRRFIQFAFERYRDDPLWVPPLRHLQGRLLGRKTAFFAHAAMRLFLARRGERDVGRIAAIHNPRHNAQHGDKVGFFGFFECDAGDAQAAAALLRAAQAWLAQRGLDQMRGPVNPSMNAECGLLVDGFDSPPMALMPYNPPDYASLLEAAGLARCKDLYAYLIERGKVDVGTEEHTRMVRAAEVLHRRYPSVSIRSIQMGNFQQEVLRLTEVFEQARRNNWGYVPLTQAELLEMACELRQVIDPELVLVAEVDGQPAGACMAIPNLNGGLAAARGRLWPLGFLRFWRAMRRVRQLRIFGIATLEAYRHMGLTAMMMLEIILRGISKGYLTAEASWVLEDNVMSNRTIQNLLAPRLYKTYRIYEKAIGQTH
jgi:GNAT superfamily N-acetyltransferase